jgi:hypothetical protein
MSMELWVLSDTQLKSIAEWQAAIDAEGYPLTLSGEASFENLSGFLPARLRGEQTGFECYHDDVAAFIRENPEVDAGHAWEFVLSFRWLGSKVEELRAAWMAGTAYAQAVSGEIFDAQEAKLRDVAGAREVVREVEQPPPNVDGVVDRVLQKLRLGPYRET